MLYTHAVGTYTVDTHTVDIHTVDTHSLHITQFVSVFSVCALKASGESGGTAPGHT
jgi:hypothetical protein